ncbi:60S ribosomal protein L7 [Patella vulgata]|uniref:60S ribosomal protein L7 n=1 Tax=Patella vulgata TaxID=6465 RepID=UPI0024A83D0D|nr:60S ribosomal protein L7 [Patella vulgata]
MTATTKKPQVPESLLKRRKEHKVHRERVKAKALTQRKERKQKRKLIFKRAQAYVKEYRTMEKQARGLVKVAAKHDNFYVPAEPKIVFVMRIRGINNIHPRPRKIMQLLRLRQINNGIFLRLNKATSNMLKLAEPYITWGTPNLKTVRDLIYKRGFAKIKGSRIPLTDNALIENILGDGA